MDNNSAFHEELNAVTLNMSGSCNATNAVIDDLTLWLESSGPGFDGNADTKLKSLNNELLRLKLSNQ